MSTLLHGHAKRMQVSRTYVIWQAMKKRCNDKNYKYYARYGMRGIFVCDRWKHFQNFLSDMGEAPESLTIERKDNDGPYAPWNCEWATRSKQQRNKANTIMLTKDGKTMCIADWADALGIPANRISVRLYKGWTKERALTP